MGNEYATPVRVVWTGQFDEGEEYCNSDQMPWNFKILEKEKLLTCHSISMQKTRTRI